MKKKNNIVFLVSIFFIAFIFLTFFNKKIYAQGSCTIIDKDCNNIQNNCVPGYKPNNSGCGIQLGGYNCYCVAEEGVDEICASCPDTEHYYYDKNSNTCQGKAEGYLGTSQDPVFDQSICDQWSLTCWKETGTCQEEERITSETVKLKTLTQPEPCYTTGDKKGIKTAIGCVPTEPEDFIVVFLNWAIGLGGGIAFLFMLFGAFQILLSSGNPEKVKAGQEQLTSAIIGLLFVIFSVFILRIIGQPIIFISSS